MGEIVRTFKALTAHRIRHARSPGFAWQRNYYEHVIRSDRALDRIREYIICNPENWATDEENSERRANP